jgi:plasmid stabilization system protein ParE
VSYRLLLRPAALAELQEACSWHEKQQPELGLEFMTAVERKLAQIESNPWQFPTVRNATKRAIVMRFPYGIFYVPDADKISVLAVMHHARMPLRWQRRVGVKP